MKTLQMSFNAIAIVITLIVLSMPKMGLAAPTDPNCKSPKTQTDMNICAGRDAEKADRHLNQVYQQLKTQITDPQSIKELTNAETTWIKFRDNDCKFAGGLYRGGSIVPTIYSGCIQELTEQRTKQLEDYLESLSK